MTGQRPGPPSHTFANLMTQIPPARQEATCRAWLSAEQPRAGSLIERLFGTTTTELLNQLRGNTQAAKHVRLLTRAVDPREQAVWTLADFSAIFSEWAYEVYDQMEQDAMVQTALTVKKLSVMAAPFRIVPASGSAQAERNAAFVAEQFAAMKPTAILVNTARGPIVEESALVAALQAGRLAGAALDVFEVEPLPLESPLMQMDNVMLAPHNSNSSPTAWENVHWKTIKNLVEGLGLEYQEA